MKRKIKNSRKPMISLHESKSLWFLEFFSILLHISLVVFTIVALTLAIEHTHVSERILLAIEITGVVLVFLIVLNYFLTPIIKRTYIKRYFKPFWGNLTVNTKIFIPNKINVDEDDFLADIESFKKMGSISNIYIGWMSKNPYRSHLEIVIADNKKVMNSFDGNYDKLFFDIPHININTKEKTIVLEAKIIIFKSDTHQFEYTDRSCIIKIDKRHQIVKWSGMMPEHPLYGTWEWK